MEYLLIIISYFSLFIALFWMQVLFTKESTLKKTKRFPIVTLTVPAYNEAHTIHRTIKSILDLDYPTSKLQILLVNDGSKDNTAQVIRKLIKGHNQFSLINKKYNEGKAAALNSALTVAKGELFACLDADSFVRKNALKTIINAFNNKNLGAVICSIRVHNPKRIIEKFQWFEYIVSAFIRKLMAKINVLFITPGVMSVYRTRTLKTLGGFDHGNLTEDFEMALRLHKHFYEVTIEPNGVGYTKAPATIKKLFQQRTRWFRGFIFNTFKHKDLFFNRQYGMLGNFQLPVTVLSVFMLLAVLSIFSFRIFKKLYLFVLDFFAMGIDTIRLLEWPQFLSFLNLDLFLLFPILLTVLITVYFFYRAHRLLKERWMHPFVFPVYLLYFGVLQASCWVTAFFKEAFKFKRKW